MATLDRLLDGSEGVRIPDPVSGGATQERQFGLVRLDSERNSAPVEWFPDRRFVSPWNSF